MKKLAGLLAFAVALACAILITKYYSAKPAPPPAPAPPAAPAPTAAPQTTNAAVAFKTQQVTLDLSAKKAMVGLVLERPAGPTPDSVWVWAYFFTKDAPGKYCEGGPAEVKRPFAAGAGGNVAVELPVTGCPAPRTPSTTYYARVNVSAESSFAARLSEQRISYDITQASPVVLQGARK